MSYVKNILKENYMLIVLTLLLLGIAIFGTWGCEKMESVASDWGALALY